MTQQELYIKFEHIPHQIYNHNFRARCWQVEEDLLQECRMYLWVGCGLVSTEFSEGEQAAYLRKIVYSRAVKWINRYYFRVINNTTDSTAGTVVDLLEIYTATVDTQLDFFLIAALERLVRANRIAFKRYILNMSIKEIAESEDVSVGSVNNRLVLFKEQVINCVFTKNERFSIDNEVAEVFSNLRQTIGG